MRSYAQNGEDARLARVLSGTAAGFYIDIGAAHPTADSVTRHFSDHGWHGIDVEPDPQLAALLRAERPRDIVVEAACSDADGALELFETGDADGWSTAVAGVADFLSGRGVQTHVRTVPAVRAARLWEEAGRPAVDFLKVDVEGHERAALLGCDLAAMRPRVLIVEATLPHRPEPTHGEWEDVVLAAGYVAACDDGLNRWYVAPDDTEAMTLLAPPISFFDHAEPHEHLVTSERLNVAYAELDELRGELRAREGEVAVLAERITAERDRTAAAETALAARTAGSLAAPPGLVRGLRAVARAGRGLRHGRLWL